jgi:glutaconate CoA-transferase subunit B
VISEPTPHELMAKVIADDLEDGEWVEVGANLPVARAGALLAHLTHGPNIDLMIAFTKAHLHDVPVIEEFDSITDVRAMRWAEAYYRHDQFLSAQRARRRRGVFFCGGLQIDRHGNSNLIGIGADHRRLDVRGPGPIGTCNATVHSSRYHLITTRHSPEVLVDRCDFVSALGYGDGTPGLREQLGLPPGGPRYLITPLCVFAFDGRGCARLRSLTPGTSVDDVRARTGFDFDVAEKLRTTPLPSETEMRLLRERIDVRGLLRGGI